MYLRENSKWDLSNHPGGPKLPFYNRIYSPDRVKPLGFASCQSVGVIDALHPVHKLSQNRVLKYHTWRMH